MRVQELHEAAASGNIVQLQAAIKQVLACDEHGRTALHAAAAAGQDTALYLLAAAGARLEAGAGQPVGTAP
jgi:ankyrin repeat protein